MKKLYLIGGTMGVGKTTTCNLLKKELSNSVFLDGDWCWDASPFQVNDETKKIVLDNICFLLNNFIKSKSYENIVFCWVMHQQEIIDEIISKLDTSDCKIFPISLVCDKESLVKRLSVDVENGIRQIDVIERSIKRIDLYSKLNTIKIDVTNISPKEATEEIKKL